VSKPGLSGLLERFGDRVVRRAEPRVGIALAGVGMVVIFTGVIVWAGERAGGDPSNGTDSDTTLGVLLCAAVVAAGHALLFRFRRGPLATAGVVATVVGVPLALGFATLDPTPSTSTESDVLYSLPFSVDAIVLVSVAAWLASYFWVPMASGRAFYLAASTFFLWLYVAEKAEPGSAGYLVTLPVSLFYLPFFYGFSELSDGPQLPDATTIGIVSALFGLGYYALAVVLDRQGRHGAATPFTVAGLVITALAIGHLAGDLEAIGTGLVLIVLGVALALHGATQGRRVTTWGWAAAAGLGLIIVLGDIFEDTAAGFGVVAILLGVAVILVGHLLTTRFAEPDEMSPGPSHFTRPPRPPSGPAAPVAAGPWTPQPGPQAPYPSSTQPQVGYPSHPPTGEQPVQPPAPAPPAEGSPGWNPF
jgi:hypothetical protein